MVQQKDLVSRIYASPCGPLTLSAMGDSLVSCLWNSPTVICGDSPVINKAVKQLDEYFGGERTKFDICLLPIGTEFQRRVWQVLADVEYGEVLTYGQLAARIGKPNAARAVGHAVGANPLNLFIPCHRIVGACNTIGGYAGGLQAKRFLLGLERTVKEKHNNKSLFS